MLRFGISHIATAPTWTRSLATLAHEARYDSTFHIPIVDFSSFRNAKSPIDQQRTARQVVDAFKKVLIICII